MTYYGVAQNSDGKLEQVLVTREGGKQVSQEWTGIIYASMKSALADLEKLNK